MNKKEKNEINYRFSGYQLPKIQLDETGPAYYCVPVHSYYYGQPKYWQNEFFYGHPNGGTLKASLGDEKIYPLLSIDGKVDENS